MKRGRLTMLPIAKKRIEYDFYKKTITFDLNQTEAQSLLGVSNDYYEIITNRCAKEGNYLIYSCPFHYVSDYIIQNISVTDNLILKLNMFEVDIVLRMIENYIDELLKSEIEADLQKKGNVKKLELLTSKLQRRWLPYHEDILIFRIMNREVQRSILEEFSNKNDEYKITITRPSVSF